MLADNFRTFYCTAIFMHKVEVGTAKLLSNYES